MPVGLPTFRRGPQSWHRDISRIPTRFSRKRDTRRGWVTKVGFAPNLRSNREALDLVAEAIGKAGYTAGKDVVLALDVASSELWQDGRYMFVKSGEQSRTSAEMIAMYSEWVRPVSNRVH